MEIGNFSSNKKLKVMSEEKEKEKEIEKEEEKEYDPFNDELMKDIITKEKKNKNVIVCKKCGEKILKPNNSDFVIIKQSLPDSEGKLVLHEKFWTVKDMYTFENISFTKSPGIKGIIKYLTCFNCENIAIGVLLSDNKSYLISVDKVKN
jgi:DNA-directed RNA polymerase subunit RPC12/RpoP